MFWTIFTYWWMTMEGSSDSSWRNSEIFKELNISMVSNRRNPRRRHAHIIDLSGDASHDYGFIWRRKNRDLALFRKHVILLFYVISILRISMAADTITAGHHIKDGETIISAAGRFELGFFSPGKSKNRYVGIWYKNMSVQTVVWVANREIPLTDSSGILKVTDEGTLVILSGTNSIVWSSKRPASAQSPNVQLLESGNLVVRNGNDSDPENFLWQSFDYPGNTLLPGMKLGIDKVTGLERYLSSWKSPDNPSKGNFTYKLDPGGHPQLLLADGLAVKHSSGPWNGNGFSGLSQLRPSMGFTHTLVFNEKEVYGTYDVVSAKIIASLVLTADGNPQLWTWIDGHGWKLYLNIRADECDNYALCGAYSICEVNRFPKCGCMEGFVPKYETNWDMGDWSGGCIRNASLDCHKGEKFMKFSGLKLPDTQKSWSNGSLNLKECASLCLRNCSCIAYANWDIRGGGNGCLLWFGDLIDIKMVSGVGQDLYVRMAASELDAIGRANRNKRRLAIISSVSTIGIILLTLVLRLYISKRKGRNMIHSLQGGESDEDLELPIYKFTTICSATNNFSSSNKLGHGGFGPVFKGTLPNGKEIAVKRLSQFSTQGSNEFKNEVIYMSKLQHRNLVKLHGYCIHGEERMLIYEYMPNKSLNYFIFDPERSMLLDWAKRFHIIKGIARGLLYLHQDSRLRIIHRDLKIDNILLDGEMNPKISDFGMARSFGGDEINVNTNTVVGTYGYMSPEYAIAGLYSTKSDVYSFGVSVLEIVSGKRNRGFCQPNSSHINLLGRAWTLYMEDRCLEMVDESMGDAYNIREVLRSIHVGLLCVQRCPDDRPSMSSVILMLSSEGALPQPKEPGFFIDRHVLDVNSDAEVSSIFRK